MIKLFSLQAKAVPPWRPKPQGEAAKSVARQLNIERPHEWLVLHDLKELAAGFAKAKGWASYACR